ncbi:MFS transporter [Ruixingdingia sedimenti]|uniref:MFS transporter n=1 Tax=Ruixingdingia sedimenti TaxID=3073604 RepID=A0ABU1F9V5_9RHOB|nr:MFS transporter [Xinfangfangia sp. LG-4]MDR5653214.1 MFS transporter [Xinfangfangia sp. LG-4]
MTRPDAPRAPHAMLWALMTGNLVIGTGVMLPSGLLTGLMADFAIPAETAGLVVLVGAVVVAVGAPVLAWATTRVDRRRLLVAALAIYALGHLAAALVPGFVPLLVLRALTVVGAAIFTPQAAATAGLIVTPQRRAAAIAFIMTGWSLAPVVGLPLGSLLGDVLGWRAAFAGLAVLSALAAVAVAFTLPRGLRVEPLVLSSWTRVLRSPALMCVLGVTLCSLAGQFVPMAYLAPLLQDVFGAGAGELALVFVLLGITGVIGNQAAGWLVGRWGVGRGVMVSLVLIAAGLVVTAAGFGRFELFLLGVCIWGLAAFAVNSLQQGRLVVLAPALASATVALNTSVVYLGQAVGTGIGGVLIARGGVTAALPLAGAVLLGLALVLSVVAARARAPAQG